MRIFLRWFLTEYGELIHAQCSHFIPPENIGFLVFSGGIKWGHWPEIG